MYKGILQFQMPKKIPYWHCIQHKDNVHVHVRLISNMWMFTYVVEFITLLVICHGMTLFLFSSIYILTHLHSRSWTAWCAWINTLVSLCLEINPSQFVFVVLSRCLYCVDFFPRGLYPDFEGKPLWYALKLMIYFFLFPYRDWIKMFLSHSWKNYLSYQKNIHFSWKWN